MPKFQLKLFPERPIENLQEDIAKGLGAKLSQMEVYVRVRRNVRALSKPCAGCNVLSCRPQRIVNEDLMELFVIIDALKRSFAKGSTS